MRERPNALFGVLECLLAPVCQVHSAFEELQGIFKTWIAVLHPPDDRFEFLQRVFERGRLFPVPHRAVSWRLMRRSYSSASPAVNSTRVRAAIPAKPENVGRADAIGPSDHRNCGEIKPWSRIPGRWRELLEFGRFSALDRRSGATDDPHHAGTSVTGRHLRDRVRQLIELETERVRRNAVRIDTPPHPAVVCRPP